CYFVVRLTYLAGLSHGIFMPLLVLEATQLLPMSLHRAMNQWSDRRRAEPPAFEYSPARGRRVRRQAFAEDKNWRPFTVRRHGSLRQSGYVRRTSSAILNCSRHAGPSY